MRLLIIGTLNGQLTTATKMAMERGAKVTHADTIDQGLMTLRSGKGADLVMIDVKLDIADLIERLEVERIHIPVAACGVENDAKAAVAAIHAGAKEYIPLPPNADIIAAVLEAVTSDAHVLIYRDEAMAHVVKLANQVAKSDASVLITGESGTGKEVLARHVHRKSMRAEKPFISLNCAAIPENLLESELFGHEKGAFTGAVARRVGKFEEANGGTLLLDEISEMDIRLQAKLLRAIQERDDRPGRRLAPGRRRYPDHRHVEPRSGAIGPRGHIPRGPALPAQRRQSEDPAAPATPDGHHHAGRTLRRKIRPRQQRAGQALVGCGARRTHHQPVARQCARAGKHHAPRGASEHDRRDRHRRPDDARRLPVR